MASLLATPLMGQPQNVCLQRNDITNWQPIDENTIVFVGWQGQNYTLKFVDTCSSAPSNVAYWIPIATLAFNRRFDLPSHSWPKLPLIRCEAKS